MSVLQIKAGTTDVSVDLRIVDSGDGTPETGVVFNTSGIALWYRREGAAVVDITEADLAALTTAHTDGGFLAKRDGHYRLDLPDAACATGVAGVQIGGTVTGMVVFGPYIQLIENTAKDVYDRVGAPAGASIAADIADVEGKVDDLETRVGTPSDLGGGASLAANLADIEAQTDDIGAAGAGLTAADDAILTILGTPAGASLAADIAAIEAQTDDIGVAGAGLTAIPWNSAWDAEVESEANDALVAQNLDHLVKSAVDTDFATTVQVNSVIGHLADDGGGYDRSTDSLEVVQANFSTISTQIDNVDNFLDTEIAAIKAVTDLLPDAGALTSLATQASVDAIDNFLDTEIADILTDTGTTLDDFVDDLESRLTAALASKLTAHAAGVLKVVIGSGSTTTNVVLNSTTGVEGAAPSATADFYNGAVLIFTTGALAGQRTSVTDYVEDNLTVVALTGAPAEGVEGILV